MSFLFPFSFLSAKSFGSAGEFLDTFIGIVLQPTWEIEGRRLEREREEGRERDNILYTFCQ